MRVAILVPDNHPGIEREFVISLVSVLSSFYVWNASIGNKHELGVFFKKDWGIDYMREGLVVEAMRQGFDYLLSMDSDMIFPSAIIQNMISIFEKHPDIEAVTGLYNWKVPPFLPHIYYKYNKKIDKFDMAGGFPLKGLFAVEGAGFGCIMIKSSIFKKIKRPYFVFKYGVFGEDLYFFRKIIKELGRPIKMFCAPYLACKHLTQISVDIHSYIQQNKIKVEKDILVPTPEQMDLISGFQKKLTDGFKNGPMSLPKKKKLDKKKRI